MASDLSSGCTEAIGVLDEKEEGEISLEDVSSSEEGHLNYGYGTRVPQCSNCLPAQYNVAWCPAPTKFYNSKAPNRRDAVQGKENRHQIKESGCVGTKHTVSTLQEKNDDLVPISSDSDMEIVGLADNSKQIVIYNASKARVKKKRKKKRTHVPALSADDVVTSSTVDASVPECVSTLKHDATKNNSSRSHHRESSPIHRSSRSRVVPRSPPRRHTSLIRPRSPFKRSKSPVVRARSPTIRRSPRRLKSPKRSPYRSPTKTMPRKPSHFVLTSSHNYVDTQKLLKIRQLDSLGTHSLEETLNKNKERAFSLKEKLTNMLKGVGDNNNDTTNSSKEKSVSHLNKKESNDIDDEEDLALLRQKALETKQKKSNKQNDQPKTEIVKKVSANIDDDQDEEDLELRMIALRSAVLKKHQNRVQRGMKSGKYKKTNTSRSESPFTQSFLDSIPIPGEELLNFASPPHTPVPVNENNHIEDMDLNTDDEKDKEKLPYSPTDKITATICMDIELLGIQPSDVSFINLNVANNSPSFNTSLVASQDDQKSLQGKIIENRSYLPNLYNTQPQNTLCVSPNTNVQYSTADSMEVSRSSFVKMHDSHVNVNQYEKTCNVLKNNNTSDFVETNSNEEMPYSPTDSPVYDPDLSHALPQNLGPITTSNSSLVSMESSHSSNTHGDILETQTMKQINGANEDEHLDKAETLSLDPAVGSATTSLVESVSPSSSMITIDDLPEINTDTSPLTDSLKNIKRTEHIPSNLAESVKDIALEPLYMKGIPDVTKDVNKIPTLINRMLVPVPILKTNKQLQQPLPVRKCEVQLEPTFKSAEMQPVFVSEDSNSKTNTSFKPMKLIPVAQKSQSVLPVSTVFHDPMHEDSANETAMNKDNSLESNQGAILVQNDATANVEMSDKTCDTVSSTQKKKKNLKKGLKRKCNGTVQVASKKLNASCTDDDNINIVDKPVNEIDNTNVPTSDTSTNTVNQNNKVSDEEISKEETKIKDTSCNDKMEETKNAEGRRQSLDEDEEALRAILLASLPKRTRSTNSVSHSATNSTVPTTVSNNQVSGNQSTPTATLSTVNLTNNNSTTLASNQQANKYGSENDKNQTNSGEKPSNTSVQKNVPVETNKTLSSITSGRKRSVPVTKGPQKKLLKKVAIPASTKVVNNAKKYQNSMIQRKLNLQKAIYNNYKITGNKLVSKTQSNDKWSTTTKTLIPDTQRIVINLESDTESDSESERQKNKTVTGKSVTAKKQQTNGNSNTEFEKNLDQFLRAVRKKQESMAAAARPTSSIQTPKKDAQPAEKPNTSNLHTPLAVRHLPASQQEEYRRLKQQILEREKLKLHRTVETNITQKNKIVETASKLVLSNSPVKELHSKVNQMISPKSQGVNMQQQIDKENCSKNLDPMNTTSISNTNTQLSADKMNSKTISRSITNLNIRISNENSVNVGKKIVGNTLQSGNTTRKVFETPARSISPKTKVSPGLKILSKDEVNRKFVQIQVKNDINKRVVTINDKVTLKKQTAINVDENISASKNPVNADTCEHDDAKQSLQSAEKENSNSITRSDSKDVDSDASTIILSKENQNTERIESVDSSESTVRLSQLHEDSRTSISSSMESKDDNILPLLKCNVPPDDKRSIEEDWKVIRRDVNTELTGLINLPLAEQEQLLTETEEKLVMKRYTILNELAEMSSNLRQWHMERDLQVNLVAEVKKLREQLKVAEERLQEQRNRIKSIGPKVVAAHGRINAGRQECFKLARICSTLGSRVVGKQYKVSEAVAQLLDNRLKEVACHTRQLSRKKVPSVDLSEVYESTKLEEETLSTVCTEVSQSEDLLNSDVDNVIDATISNENESLTESNETEKPVSFETVTLDLNEESKREDKSTEDNSPTDVDESNVHEQNNDEEEGFLEHQDETTTNTLEDTLSTTVSKDAEDPECEENSETKALRPTLTMESCKEKRSSTKRSAEHYTKRIYESILMHFKLPRNTNPTGIFCPYELMGICNDGDCQFVHPTRNQAK